MISLYDSKQNTFLTVVALFSLFCFFLFSIPAASALTWNIDHTTVISNSSEFWITSLGSLGDANVSQFQDGAFTLTINESWLESFGGSMWCELTGCSMAGNIDMNSNNILEIDKAYFASGVFISSDDPKHLDIHADYIDLRGNLSTIWNIRLNADGNGSVGPSHGNLVFGGGGDTYLFYNDSDFIIDPDVVGSGDVFILGDLRVDYFYASGAYLTDLNVSGDVDVAGLIRGGFIDRFDSGFWDGSLYTQNTSSSSNNNNALFIVMSDTRGDKDIPMFQVQDGGVGQASFITRSFMVINQNNTLLNSSQNNLCSDWGFNHLDCDTALTGADFGVIDDIEAQSLIWSGGGFRAAVERQSAFFVATSNITAISNGSNGTYITSTNIFCDDVADVFTDTEGVIQITADGTEFEGAMAYIQSFINSSCVELSLNPGWNTEFSDLTWEQNPHPDLYILQGGAMEYHVGEDPRAGYVIHIPNGTGFTGIFINDVAGADQHQGLTLDQEINNYAGIVGFNIFTSSGNNVDTTVGKDYHLQTLEVDTRNINTSLITFIGALQFGENIDNQIDFLHLSGNFDTIIRAGANVEISKAYYDNGAGSTTDVTTAFIGTGVDIAIFENDDSIIYIGNTVNFTTIGLSLLTESSTNIDAVYFYCNSTGDWVNLLGVTDTTNGMKTSGTIHWANPSDRGICNQEIDGTPFADPTDFTYIAIQRTRNNVVIPPIENLITISGGGSLMILKNDYMRLNPTDVAPEACTANVLGGIYFDISEDDMCVCKSSGWKVMSDGSECT